MRASDRMDLLEKVGTELQNRYTFVDINAFFNALNIPLGAGEIGGFNSKRVYAKSVLSTASNDDLIRVAAELNMVPTGSVAAAGLPQNWNETTQFRLFISHLSKDRQTAMRLKSALMAYEISGFVAHEDVNPTLAWQDEIERALNTMDALVAVHTQGFSASFWTQQEVGFALGRGTKIISFRMGEDPTGFIGKHQALSRQGRTAEQIAKELDALLESDPRTSGRLDQARAAAVPF